MNRPGPNEPVRWLLEYTFDGEEYGNAVYESEEACRRAAEADGGTCVALIRTPDEIAIGHLILRITTAYEQGFGHGLQLRKLPNPYSQVTPEHSAWGHGYEVAAWRKQRAPSTKTPDIWEMNYCEHMRCSLHPGVTYRFKVDPECESCVRMASEHRHAGACPDQCQLKS